MKRHFIISLFFIIVSSKIFPSHGFIELKKKYQISEFYLKDRFGETVHQLRRDFSKRRLKWTKLENISPALVKAVIRAEDKRFYKHSGVDFLAVFSTLENLFRFEKIRGASTITMQLVNILNSDNLNYKRKGFFQKIKQMYGAFKLEKKWTKDEILEAYLNLVWFRGELQGINTVSQALFSKRPIGLNFSESAILAVLIRSPNAKIKRIKKRACHLLDKLKKDNVDTCTKLDELILDNFNRNYKIDAQKKWGYHLAHRLLRKTKKTFVKTSLVASVQRFVIEAINRQLQRKRGHNQNDFSVLVVENKTGQVVAYVGSSGKKYSKSPFVDGVVSLRQAGSTLKPFIYGLGIDKLIITTASIVKDDRHDFKSISGLYRPQNYDNRFKGFTTVRESLALSLNVPAVKILKLIGKDPVLNVLRKMNFKVPYGGEYYGLALALGSLDVTLWHLVNAYRMIANDGIWSSLTFLPTSTKGKKRKIFSRQASFILKSILSDNSSRISTFGMHSYLKTPFWTAVKTGTSKDMRDNWCVGFSDKYTVGVWAGNFSGGPMWDVSGVTGAGPVWSEIIHFLHKKIPSHTPKIPSKIIRKRIYIEKLDKEFIEWFISGTEPNGSEVGLSKVGNFSITYPIDQMIIGLDPSIPNKYQKVAFETPNWHKGFYWILNKRVIYKNNNYLWSPFLGDHTLALVNEKMQEIDSVRFQVR